MISNSFYHRFSAIMRHICTIMFRHKRLCYKQCKRREELHCSRNGKAILLTGNKSGGMFSSLGLFISNIGTAPTAAPDKYDVNGDIYQDLSAVNHIRSSSSRY